MTLEELKSKCFSMPGHVPPARLYVFTDEDSADDWCNSGNAFELLMVLQSDMIANYTIKEEWCKAKVQHFYAVGEDELVVVVEKPERKKQKLDGDIQVGDVVKLVEEQDDPTALQWIVTRIIDDRVEGMCYDGACYSDLKLSKFIKTGKCHKTWLNKVFDALKKDMKG